ncbi:hypothetical protein V5H41_29715, partial [Salmonella enterica]
ADEVFLLQPPHIPWQVAEVAEACVQPAHWSGDVDTLRMKCSCCSRRIFRGKWRKSPKPAYSLLTGVEM